MSDTLKEKRTTVRGKVVVKKATKRRTATSAKKKATKKARKKVVRYILLGMNENLRNQLGKSNAIVCNDTSEIRAALENVNKESVWISPEADQTDLLLRSIRTVAAQRMGHLYMFKKPRPNTLPFLHSAFQTVVGESPSFVSLPVDQFADVMSLPKEDSQDLFIGGTLDRTNKLLSLVRGNFERLTVPLDVFRPSQKSRPDFSRFSIGEYGHSLVFGDYEASAAYVLSLVDPDYRRRTNALRRAEDKGFGPSLRRLRIQNGLKRSDFGDVSSKTIARIERGEVGKPRGTTLQTICEVLGVKAQEIETY